MNIFHSAHKKKHRSLPFKQYDKRRFAVLLGGPEASQPLRGMAHFERDHQLGDALRIILDGDLPGSPVVVVCERAFSGRILPDEKYGTDYCLLFVNERNDATAYGNTRTRGEG